jgi:hypothetical protein
MDHLMRVVFGGWHDTTVRQERALSPELLRERRTVAHIKNWHVVMVTWQ